MKGVINFGIHSLLVLEVVPCAYTVARMKCEDLQIYRENAARVIKHTQHLNCLITHLYMQSIVPDTYVNMYFPPKKRTVKAY